MLSNPRIGARARRAVRGAVRGALLASWSLGAVVGTGGWTRAGSEAAAGPDTPPEDPGSSEATRGASYFIEDFEQPFFVPSPDHYVKDHTMVMGPDDRFHLFYIVGRNDEAWQIDGNEVDFGHASSSDLVHWTAHPHVVAVDSVPWRSRNVWAPHVVTLPPDLGGGYLMSYTGVDSLINQRTGSAISPDLFTWTDLWPEVSPYAPDPAWAEWDAASSWSTSRDPFVWLLEAGGSRTSLGSRFAMVTSAQTREGYEDLPARGAISLALSSDGRHWRDVGSPLVVNDDASIMESAHLAWNPVAGEWTLFYTRTGGGPKGIYTLRTSDPLSRWSIETRASLVRGFASEIFEDQEGVAHLSTFHGYGARDGRETRGLLFDRLQWTAEGPTLDRTRPFDTRWNLISGDLGVQPSYHGRGKTDADPGAGADMGADEPESDWFWIDTADGYAGPLSEEGACSTCPPQVSLTGVLRSQPWIVRGDRMDMWIGGSVSTTAYLAMVDAESGAILFRESGNGTGAATKRTWNLCALRGRRVALEIVDNDPLGHLTVDLIAEREIAEGEPPCLPDSPILVVAVPNPSASRVTLELRGVLPDHVEATVLDVTGRTVRRLASTGARARALEWDGYDAEGRRAPAGIYVVRLRNAAGAQIAGDVRVVRLRSASSRETRR